MTPGGIWAPHQLALPLNWEEMEPVLMKWVRGLYYYHEAHIIPLGCEVMVGITQERRVQEFFEMLILGSRYTVNHIGGVTDIFTYGYTRMEGDGPDSLWLMAYGNGPRIYAAVGPTATRPLKRLFVE
ncbi:MAG TPA: hypothetical protein VGM37_12240 [Armatimonadota bacterium]